MKASVQDQSRLIDLQLIDSAISSAQVKLKNLPEREQLVAINSRLQKSAEELAVVEAELADVTIDLRRSEIDVEQVVDRMKKDEVRLASGSASPKELESLQHELESLAKRKAELEDSELEIMLRHDGVKTRVEELRNDEVGLQQLALELNVRLENGITELEKEIAAKRAERTLLLPQIDSDLVAIYEKVRSNNNGTGAALLVGNTCKGCNLAINAIEVERIKTLASDEVLRCEECRVILVRI